MATVGENFKPRQFQGAEAHEVVPKIFVGSWDAAKDKESLESNGITHILTINGKEPAFKDNFEYMVINFGGEDGPITPHLDDSMSFVKAGAEKGGVLIHCTHGTGRSAVMTAAAVMTSSGGSSGGGMGDFDEAFRLVNERRPGVSAPETFLEEVKEWRKRKST